MDTAHKEALAIGRAQGRVVRRYLSALEDRPKATKSVDTLRKRLEEVVSELENDDLSPVRRIALTQSRIDLEKAIDSAETTEQFSELEDEFKKVAGEYASRKGITYQAWREVGVPAATLREAGITRH